MAIIKISVGGANEVVIINDYDNEDEDLQRRTDKHQFNQDLNSELVKIDKWEGQDVMVTPQEWCLEIEN